MPFEDIWRGRQQKLHGYRIKKKFRTSDGKTIVLLDYKDWDYERQPGAKNLLLLDEYGKVIWAIAPPGAQNLRNEFVGATLEV